jgi:hypothetical protein
MRLSLLQIENKEIIHRSASIVALLRKRTSK